MASRLNLLGRRCGTLSGGGVSFVPSSHCGFTLSRPLGSKCGSMYNVIYSRAMRILGF